MAQHAAHGHGHEEHGSWWLYIYVFFGLLGLTVASFAVGNWTYGKDTFPGAVWAFMMAVSVAKALLVILFFMHLKWEANWKYVLTIPCCIMSVFLVLMLVPDIGRRVLYYSEERWEHASTKADAPYPNAMPHIVHDTTHTGDAHVEKTGH